MNQQTFIPSPCIRKCGLDERDICRGCFRSMDEILRWESMDTAAREQTLDNCRQRRERRASRR
jgi:hypothetical protein